MKTNNDLEISDKLTSDYLERLRNRVFSLLYKYESVETLEDRIAFNLEQRVLTQTIYMRLSSLRQLKVCSVAVSLMEAPDMKRLPVRG